MNVSLTPELEQFIDGKLQTGFYGSASEVIREGLRLLEERDSLKQKRIEMLNQEIDKGLYSLQSGNLVSGDAAYQDLLNRRDSYSS